MLIKPTNDMKKICFILAALCCLTTMEAKTNGIPSELFKDGKIKYEKATNTLIPEDGFKFSQSTGLVIFDTGKDLRIRLKGSAEFRASLLSKDNLIIEAEKPATLSITSNISGSALQCPALTVNKDATVSLFSRNSQEGMYALSCDAISVNAATLLAEVTTANLAVQTKQLNLNGSWLEKPKGGFVDKEKACICYGDSLPAKRVRITLEKKQ